MNIWLYQKIVYRYDTPSDREKDGHIQKMERRFISRLRVDANANIPHVGDVYYINKIPYEIKRRIFVPDESETKINDCVCEVVVFNSTYTTSYGSDSWRETIPLVTEMSDEVIDVHETKSEDSSKVGSSNAD